MNAEPTGAAFAPDAELDATVPGSRFRCEGRVAIDAQFATWYAHPAKFEELRRLPVAGGEVVEWTLVWAEDGVPHASHQAHVIEVGDDGLIRSDRMWCGGRWDAARLAEMESASRGR